MSETPVVTDTLPGIPSGAGPLIRVMRAVRWVAAVVLTALVAGSVAGLAARLAMRVVALTDHEPGTEFTVGGTLGIVVVAVVFDAIATAVYSPFGIKIAGSHVKKGLVLGAVFVAFPGLIVLLEAIEVGRPLLNVPLFTGVAVVNGLAIAVTFGRLYRALPGPGKAQPPEAAAQASSSRSGPNTALGM